MAETLQPTQGIRVKQNKTYVFDPNYIDAQVGKSEEWATKTDGKVKEEGVEIDYSSKAYAIGGTGTETNNAKYYAGQAAASASSASIDAGIASAAASDANVVAVGTDLQDANSKIKAVANNKTNIDTVAGIASDVSTVASKASEVDTVATNIADVNTAAANIQAIQDAPTQASNAQKWAEGSDADVAALGGTHSAKGWANQEANNYSVTSTGSTTQRTLKDRFSDILNVKDFGAKGDGLTDDTAAIQAMITAVGYANFSKGTFMVQSDTFDAPLFFDSGASLTVPSGKAIIITNTINAPKEYIFKGDGAYTLKNDTDSGTEARNVEAWWFGIVPDVSLDQSSKIQKALNSVGNNRESILHFDIGAFSIGSTITVPRACLIKGEGIRRTVFRPLTDGWNAFETDNVGVRFSNIQFENPDVATIRNYPFIVINHANCQIYDVAFLCNAKSYIEVNAEYTRIDGVMYGISKALGSGSSLIKILSSHNIVNNIFSSTSSTSYYPESIVKITNADNTTVEYNVINGIQNYNPATAVFIDSVSGTIRRTTISDIVTGGTTGAVAIKLSASGSANISNVDIWDVHPYLTCAKGIYIVNSGTGVVQDFTIDGLNFDGTTTDGIYLERGSTGQVRYITIGADINWQGVTNKITTVGSVSGIIKALRTDNILTDITGYDPTKTQSLKHVSGVLQWVTDS